MKISQKIADNSSLMLGVGIALLIIIALFSTEGDSFLYWGAAYLINKGYTPFFDFYSYQFPPTYIYFQALFTPFISNLVPMRLLYVLFVCITMWQIGRVFIKNKEYDNNIIRFCADFLLGLTCLAIPLAHQMSVGSKNIVPALGFTIVSLLISVDIVKQKWSLKYIFLILLMGSFAGSMKLLNLGLLPTSLVLIYIINKVFHLNWNQKKIITYFIYFVSLMPITLYIQQSNSSFYVMSYKLYTEMLPYGQRPFHSDTIYVILYIITHMAIISFIMVLTHKKQSKNILQNYKEKSTLLIFIIITIAITGVYGSLYSHSFAYVEIAIINFVVISVLLKKSLGVTNKSYTLICLIVLVCQIAIATNRLPIKTSAPLGLHPIGGIYQHIQFEQVAQFIQKNYSNVPNRNFFTGRFANPVMIANENLNLESMFTYETNWSNKPSLEYADKWHINTDDRIYQLMLKDSITAYILAESEGDDLNELLESRGSNYRLVPIYKPSLVIADFYNVIVYEMRTITN